MVSLDLYRLPSIRRKSPAPVAKGRYTVLDGALGQQKAQRADPARVRDLLSQLIQSIEGKPLSAFVPMAEAVPLLIGLTPGNLAAFDEFLGSFIGTVVGDLGRVVTPGSVTSPADSVSANRRQLAAGSLGVKRAANVQPGQPASRRKFDELMAFFSDGKTLASVLGDGDDGLPPATAEIVGAMLTAIKNKLKSGDPAAARQAGADAGVVIAAIHASFFTEASEKSGRMRRSVRDHTTGFNGPVLVKKGGEDTARARVTAIEMNGVEFVVDPRTGKTVRKRKRRA